jgi:2-succinyl-6-hydroxy-2,4-cyclohexadiene-1-carboxylate synthase
MRVWALSGFLGLPADWNFLPWKNLTAVDWQMFALNSLPEWGKAFNHWVVQQGKEPRILMGYSLGGRLALHALIDKPQLWQAAIIVSAHTGLTDNQERLIRLQRDQGWAKRFECENWISLMEAWNGQEVFAADSFSFNRQESDYQRVKLVQALVGGSLGSQADLRQKVASLPFPILWITGNQDHCYCQIAQSLAFSHPYSYWKQIERAGHRVPWSQPQAFSEAIATFLKQLTAR